MKKSMTGRHFVINTIFELKFIDLPSLLERMKKIGIE